MRKRTKIICAVLALSALAITVAVPYFIEQNNQWTQAVASNKQALVEYLTEIKALNITVYERGSLDDDYSIYTMSHEDFLNKLPFYKSDNTTYRPTEQHPLGLCGIGYYTNDAVIVLDLGNGSYQVLTEQEVGSMPYTGIWSLTLLATNFQPQFDNTEKSESKTQ